MNTQQDNISIYKRMTELMLPEGILDYFEVVDIRHEGDVLYRGMTIGNIVVTLEERNIPPEGHGKLTANGFVPSVTVRDYPMRRNSMKLEIRRRRWTDSRGRNVERDWSRLVAKGMKVTAEFADFLKGDTG